MNERYSPANPNAQPSVDWSAIDTVLLDMDGTLLDLRFDNYFWLELIPRKYGELRGITLTQARAELMPRFESFRGCLEWYCTDHWSRELGLDVVQLKHDAREHIAWLPGAREFLEWLTLKNKRRYLVTNAHPDTLRIKAAHTDLHLRLDECISTHPFGMPKEDERFWPALCNRHPFDPSRTLFIDDSLPILRAARAFGIVHIVRVLHPDTTQAPNECREFAAVHGVRELMKQHTIEGRISAV